MTSLGLSQKANTPQCFCALCSSSFPPPDDNLFRRRSLHDFCRMAEEMPTLPMEPLKSNDLVVLEDQLKRRVLVSLCDECFVFVGLSLTARAISKEYEASVIHQQQNLNREVADLWHSNLTVSQHLNAIKEKIETSENLDFKFPAIRSIDDGLKLFRDRVIECKWKLRMKYIFHEMVLDLKAEFNLSLL